MNIHSKPGSKVKFVGGHMSDKLPHPFVMGNIYVVEQTYAGAWHTDVKFEGISGLYNSTWFENVEES